MAQGKVRNILRVHVTKPIGWVLDHTQHSRLDSSAPVAEDHRSANVHDEGRLTRTIDGTNFAGIGEKIGANAVSHESMACVGISGMVDVRSDAESSDGFVVHGGCARDSDETGDGADFPDSDTTYDGPGAADDGSSDGRAADEDSGDNSGSFSDATDGGELFMGDDAPYGDQDSDCDMPTSNDDGRGDGSDDRDAAESEFEAVATAALGFHAVGSDETEDGAVSDNPTTA